MLHQSSPLLLGPLILIFLLFAGNYNCLSSQEGLLQLCDFWRLYSMCQAVSATEML